ncbi:MAG: DMT family transporter [Eubacterium sp.]|nr:DMT family transporter [Eubacterium sp.]
MNNIKGTFYVILSAVLFGFTPILGKITYLQGSNAIMLTFLRALFSVPILFAILKFQGIDLKITRIQARELLILSFIGSAITTVFLYQSYNYIPVGTATTLHFVYPLFVALGAVIIFKEHLSLAKIVALILATGGITFFANGLNGGGLGILLALVSGLTYAFYILYLDKSSLLTLHPMKLSFYINLIISLCVLIYGLATQSLTLALTPSAWGLSLAVAVLCGFLGITLFQMGVKLVGSTTSAILSMFEPITSVFCGILLLGEPLEIKSILGCVLILLGVTVLTLFKGKAPDKN